MKFTLHINLGNDAMSTPEDVTLALNSVCEDMRIIAVSTDDEWTIDRGRILDIMGNRVGEWAVTQ